MYTIPKLFCIRFGIGFGRFGIWTNPMIHDDANIIFSDQTTYMNSICVQCVCSALWCECTVRAGQLIILIYLPTKGKYLCGLHDT